MNRMNLIIAILGSIAAIFGIIILHELGHFVVARMCGIKILKFSIGFGKALWRRTSKRGTEYIFAILPLGGYVKMLGEGDEVTTPEDAHRAFNQKPLLSRMIVVVAGPLTNLAIAVIAFWGVYLMGVSHARPIIGTVIPNSIAAESGIKPRDELVRIDGVNTPNWQRVVMAVIMRMGDRNPMTVTVKPVDSSRLVDHTLNLSTWMVDKRNPDFFQSLGFFPYRPKVPPVVSAVAKDSPAEKAGLMPGDRVVSIDGQSVADWVDIVSKVERMPSKTLIFNVLRNNKQKRIPVAVGVMKQNSQAVGYIGVISSPPSWPKSFVRQENFSFFGAWIPAVEQTWTLIRFNFVVMIKMIEGKISVHTLGGPITVFQAAGKATQAGLQVYLGFIGFISLTIGFINLLPIPGLDGGHLLFQVIEGIFRRPVPERIQMIGLSIGMVFLIFLMVQATINDVIRLFTG